MSDYQLYRPVLVVDDEADLRDLIQMTLTKMGLQVETAAGVKEAKAKLAKKTYDLVLTDMRMPDGNGLEVVEFVNQHSDTPVAVITAYGNADHAVQAMKIGAFDYIQKPITLAQLRTLVKSAIKIHDIPEKPKIAPKKIAEKPSVKAVSRPTPVVSTPMVEADSINNDSSTPATNTRLLGKSQAMEEVRQLIAKLARSDVSVYITGESGTGKEQAARSIHESSARADKPFIAVNCGAIPENLMESEFFGYKKGSFTGADSDRNGFFQAAHGGTLFLDEVADLPLSMQVKLLRVIQEKAVRRIGEHVETPVNVRIICATHKNLEHEVAENRFRQDLYYRLNIVTLTMPPLRELHEDLPFLVSSLLKKIEGGAHAKIKPDAHKQLLQYSYPGNFRELENILERAVALAGDEPITAEDLQLRQHDWSERDLAHDDDEDNDDLTDFAFGKSSLQDYLDQVEIDLINQALQQTRYNRTQAAKLLGITFRSMRYRMDRLDIE
ncbi:MAG: sigma-54 dependent transcriptional regulator [Neisseria sp.]|nr:sigma-54 dependent transcriptional regulator [Neisseria sp.]